VARLPEIRARIASLSELADVVSAMRSLAAVRVQQARATLPGIRTYTEVVDAALVDALSLVPPAPIVQSAKEARGAALVVVLASEHGFVGAFNERVLDRAATEIGRPRDQLLVVGSRGAALAAERRMPIAWRCPMATRSDGVLETARRVAQEVYARVAEGDLARVAIVYARSGSGAGSEPVTTELLPFDPTPRLARARPGGPRPLTNLPPRALLDKLVDELVLAELTRAATESFASENGARLATMEAAHENIESKLAELSAEERQRRQDEITTELLDVVTGAEAMRDAPVVSPRLKPRDKAPL
jgi:F-type H+-transporting ATPase subunit gamma